MLSDSKIALGRTRARPMTCFWPPGRSQERFGAFLGPTLGPHGGPWRPRELQELIFDPPEAPQGPYLTYVSLSLRCHSDALRLLFLCFCVCVCVFARVFFKDSIVNLQSNNPKSLKPWGAAGGSRSDKNYRPDDGRVHRSPRPKNPAAHWPRRCVTMPPLRVRSFKLREAKL